MHIRQIKTDEDHEAALRQIEGLLGAEEGTNEGDQLGALVTLVETYERDCWPQASRR